MATLHITNGDSLAGTLNDLSNDPVLPWRDVLHDGPVPGSLDATALNETRARFLAERGAAPYDLILADFVGRDAQLAATGPSDKVVLWFEPDLYDQLQLLQILTHLYLKPPAQRPEVCIVEADELLGLVSKKQLAQYHDRQRTVREVDLELAAAGWEAFTSADDTLLKQFANTESALHSADSYASGPAVVLPYLHAAMRRLLQEYPSASNGLSRTEQQTVDALLSGARTVGDTYQAAHAPREEWVWLGDSSFAWYVQRLMRGAAPVIAFADSPNPAEAAQPPVDAESHAEFWNRKIQLTAVGEAVAKGEANAIALNGIDRWIGGVHLVKPANSI